MSIIDFDSNTWLTDLDKALSDVVTTDVKARIRAGAFDLMEDARKALVDWSGEDAIINATLTWIRNSHVRIYHGTRLTNDEVNNLPAVGLRKLSVDDRIKWLRETFSTLRDELTPELAEAAVRLHNLRVREDGVHAAISRNYVANATKEAMKKAISHRLRP